MPTREPEENKLVTVGGSLGIPAAAYVGNAAVDSKVMHDFQQDREIGGRETGVTAEQVKDRSGFPKDRIFSGNESQYLRYTNDPNSEKDMVRLSSGASPEVASHEFGHASMRDPGALNKIRRGAFLSRHFTHPWKSGLAGLAISGTGYATDNPYLTDMGVGVTAIPQALMLGEEAIASIKGYNMLRRMGGNPRVSRYLWPFATYATGAGFTAGIPAYLSYKQHHQQNGENVKESSMNPQYLQEAFERGCAYAMNSLEKEAAATPLYQDAYNYGVKVAMEEIEKVSMNRMMKEMGKNDPQMAEKIRANRAAVNYKGDVPMDQLNPAHQVKVQQGQEFSKHPAQKKKLTEDFRGWVNKQRGVGSPNAPTRPGDITEALRNQDGGMKNMMRKVPGLLAKHPVATALGAGALGLGLGGALMGGQKQQQPQVVIAR